MAFAGNVLNRVREVFFREKYLPASDYRVSQNNYYQQLGLYGYDVLGRGVNYGGSFSDYVRLENDLVSRYIDAEEMDDNPIIASAYDIYADDASQPDIVTEKSLEILTQDDVVRERLEHLFDKQIRIEEELWEIARTLAKYGNDFEEIIIKENEGIVALNFCPPPTIRRIEGDRGELIGFIQDFKGQFNVNTSDFFEALDNRGFDEPSVVMKDKIRCYEDWEICHMRLRSRNRKSLYGFSVADSARWIWKRLTILEDAVIMYKLTRSPTRYAFYVDVGDLPPNEATGFLRKVKDDFKKRKFVNPKTGRMDQRYHSLAIDEDFFLPTRGGKDGTRVDLLSGPASQTMDDVEYFEEKLYAALKIPKAYLSQSETLTKASLSQADVRFARTVLRIQREIRNGLKKIARVHLAATGIDPDATEFELSLTVPSAIFELAKLEVEGAKLDLAVRYKEFASEHWIMSKILGWSDDEIALMIREKDGETDTAGTSESLIITPEQKLFSGNREHEKRLEQNLEGILKNDREMNRRFQEMRGFLEDIRNMLPGR